MISITESITDPKAEDTFISFLSLNAERYGKHPSFLKLLESCLKITTDTAKLGFINELILSYLQQLADLEEGFSLLRFYAYTEKNPLFQQKFIKNLNVNIEFFTSKKEGLLLVKHFIYGFCIPNPIKVLQPNKYERLQMNLRRLDKSSENCLTINFREFIQQSYITYHYIISNVCSELIEKIDMCCETHSIELLHFIYVKINSPIQCCIGLQDYINSKHFYKLLKHEKGAAIISKFIVNSDWRSVHSIYQKIQLISQSSLQLSSPSHYELIKTLNDLHSAYLNYSLNPVYSNGSPHLSSMYIIPNPQQNYHNQAYNSKQQVLSRNIK